MVVTRTGGEPSPMPQPNYVNPPSRTATVLGPAIVFGVLVTASLMLRLFTRGRIKRKFELDDLFAVFATLLTDTSFVIMIFIYVVFHEARHTWDIPPRDRYYMRKLGFVFNIMFAEAACQSKLSLLFFTYKMIGAAKYGTFYSHYICLIILMSIVAICEVLFVILACLECRPLKAVWDSNPTYPYKCFNGGIFLFVMGVINTLTDFLCTALPAFIVLKLHMPLNKRLGVASLFLFGIVVNIASALRIYYTYYQYETSDTWYMVPPAICSILELGLGLLCVNLPIIRPLITHYRKTALAYLRSRTSSAKLYASDNTKYSANAYGNSRRSNRFIPVYDDSEVTAPTNQGQSSVHAWRNKNGTDVDGIEVLRTVELNAVAAPGSKEYIESNRSEEMPLHQ